MSDLLSVKVALERMLKWFSPVETTTVPLERSLGMILAENIISDTDLPPFDNSSMDGFAVRSGDTAGAAKSQPVQLDVVLDIPAGTGFTAELAPGQAARIMTGAILPTGADAVVPIEDTNFNRGEVNAPLPPSVQIYQPARKGAYLRPKGQDLHQGDQVLQSGRCLTPQDLGILATLGKATVPIFRRPRVALLSSGDELVTPSEPLSPGKIRDSNSYTLAALCEQNGAETTRLGIVKDDPDLIRERLELAIDRSVDLILTSAGVSVGAFDYVRSVIEENGNLTFWRVNMRPGKPLAFGAFRGIPLIGLPGNPVSSYVGFQVFVVPVLRRLSGQPEMHRPRLKVFLDESLESDGRETYFRAILFEKCGKIRATLAGHQGSGNLFSLVKANALIILPAGVTSLQKDAEVDAWLLDTNWSAHE